MRFQFDANQEYQLRAIEAVPAYSAGSPRLRRGLPLAPAPPRCPAG